MKRFVIELANEKKNPTKDSALYLPIIAIK